MLLDDYVVTQGKAKACSFAGRLGREEGIEGLLFYFGRNSAAIVTNLDLDVVTETSCCRGEFVLAAIA
jgi:hypothetical protein